MDKYSEKILKYKDDSIFIVFFMDHCPYSKSAIKLLKDKKLSYKAYRIKRNPDRLPILLEYLKNNQSLNFDKNHVTLPIIFYKKSFIGGYSDLMKYLTNSYVVK